MNKRVLILVVYILSLFLAPNSVGYAKGNTVFVSPMPVVDEESFTFSQLKEDEIKMVGPFATHAILFGLPANWELTEGAKLDLDVTIAIQTAAGAAASLSSFGGSLTILLNNQSLAVLPLSESGSSTQSISIPLPAFTSLREDGRMNLEFILSSSEACQLDQKLDVIIHATSRFTIPHSIIQPDTSLVNFPRPIFQDSIFPDIARIIIPDQPTAAELQAALTVAAGLQARTGDGMTFTVSKSSGLTPDFLADANLILIGNAASLPMLYQLPLPSPVVDGKYSGTGDYGVLQMIVSPWNIEHVVLIVSGNNDQAVIKSAQALSTGIIRPNSVTNLALVDKVDSKVYSKDSTTDQTFKDLGYDNITFEGRGEATETVQFYIPNGQTVSADAFVELSLSSSTLLNYARSGIFVSLNDKPIGSVRLSDDTANKSNSRIRISIPASAIRSGLNFLDITAALEPTDECADPNQAGLFTTIWSDSRLYLPLVPAPINTIDIPDLASYPSPFNQTPNLGNVAFVLQRDNFDAWVYAIQIASELGATSDGPIFTPAAFYADDFPESQRSSYNVLAIGAPSKMPFVGEINDRLPAPFLPGSDNASETELQVVYQIDPELPAGYLELMPSPWNLGNVIITVTGNSPAGISWAADSLLSEITRPRLIGNFAVIRDKQVLTIDTRIIAKAQEPTPAPPTTALPPGASGTDIPVVIASTPGWVPVALFATIFMIFVVIGVAVFNNWRNKRKK
jgi:hypothetical protein